MTLPGKPTNPLQKAKLNAAREEEYDENEKKRQELGVKRPKVKRPPKGAVGGVAWANQIATQCLYEVMTDPVIKTETRWRFASDFIAKIGLTHSKAVTEEKINKLEKTIGIAKNAKDDEGLEDDPEMQ